jgi:hypothetical protein
METDQNVDHQVKGADGRKQNVSPIRAGVSPDPFLNISRRSFSEVEKHLMSQLVNDNAGKHKPSDKESWNHTLLC